MNMKNADTTKSSLHSTSENNPQLKPSGNALNLTPTQLEEALEERVSPDRRRKERTLPDAIIDRRTGERRTESN